jgi:hypothetical protein
LLYFSGGKSPQSGEPAFRANTSRIQAQGCTNPPVPCAPAAPLPSHVRRTEPLIPKAEHSGGSGARSCKYHCGCTARLAGSVYGLHDCGPAFRFAAQVVMFLCSTVSRPALGPTQRSVQWVPELHPSGQGVKWTTHLHVVPKLRMREALTPLPHTCLCGVMIN